MVADAPVIVWLRRDLRLADNLALTEAEATGRPVIPVFVWEDDAPRPHGAAARWWLHHSLQSLGRRLAALGTRLVLRRGKAAQVLPQLAYETDAALVMWNRRVDPRETAIDDAVQGRLEAMGVAVSAHGGTLLFDPERVLTQDGRPFRVFTPFWRCCLKQAEPRHPLPAPGHLTGMDEVKSEDLGAWSLYKGCGDWTSGLATTWTPGEETGRARLVDFLDEGLGRYAQSCDALPDHGTSRLSPHLAFGEISPRQVWHACRSARAFPEHPFLRELVWREFFQHTLIRNPDFAERPQRPEFEAFPWIEDDGAWRRFVAGGTGYPIVDAGMRALWETGWIHNRVRMIVGSFLVKDLMIPWQRGEQWFWDTLVDADLAANAGNWQWVAGCGCDAAPYFRVFNPVLQGEKFDPCGHYVRRWVPEIAGLPDRYVHRPWEAPPAVAAKAGLSVGRSYPAPIVEHGWARRRAVAAFRGLRAPALPGEDQPG